MTNPDLAALSAAATKGQWVPNVVGNGAFSTFDHMPVLAGKTFDVELCCALVNAYRTGNLVQIDEGMRERVWHEYRFQAACHRYAHEGGSSEAIAAAAIAAMMGGAK